MRRARQFFVNKIYENDEKKSDETNREFFKFIS